MSTYPTIRNPLLPSPPPSATRSKFRGKEILSSLSLSRTATLTTSISTSSIRSFMNQTIGQIRINQKRRIMPSGMQKSMTDRQADLKHYTMKRESLENEPLVHYNGPHQTLESLPLEKLNWIKDEQTSSLVKNPLTFYDQSIVLRKPVTRSQTYPNFPQTTSRSSTKPRGMFYIRILQIVATDSSKARLFRCGIQVNQETCLSSYITSEKTGKKSCIAQFDETFLFDIDDSATATINVYSQNKGSTIFSSKNQKQEVCVGQEVIQIPLQPKSKTTERFVLNSDPKTSQSNDLQLLLVHGTFVSHRTQNMLNDTILYEDFITIYVHAGMAPRWDRFWGVLRGVQFLLYDFEYKESRPPLYTIPLDNFINAIDSSDEEEEEIDVDIGAKSIILEFTERAMDRREAAEELECRMYLLPENMNAAREWKEKFNYAGTIFDELRGWDSRVGSDYSDSCDESSSFYSASSDEEEEGKLFVPSKFLW